MGGPWLLPSRPTFASRSPGHPRRWPLSRNPCRLAFPARHRPLFRRSHLLDRVWGARGRSRRKCPACGIQMEWGDGGRGLKIRHPSHPSHCRRMARPRRPRPSQPSRHGNRRPCMQTESAGMRSMPFGQHLPFGEQPRVVGCAASETTEEKTASLVVALECRHLGLEGCGRSKG